MTDAPETPPAPVTKARLLITHLEASGKPEHAATLRASVDGEHVEGAGERILFALREFCRTILTAVEAIDPATEALVEELRTEVDSHIHVHETKNATK